MAAATAAEEAVLGCKGCPISSRASLYLPMASNVGSTGSRSRSRAGRSWVQRHSTGIERSPGVLAKVVSLIVVRDDAGKALRR